MLRWLMILFGRYPTAPDERQRARATALQGDVDVALQQLREQQDTFQARNDDLGRTVDSRRHMISEALRQLKERWP